MASQLFFLQTAIEGSMQRQRIFRDRLNPLDTYSDTDFIVRYRMLALSLSAVSIVILCRPIKSRRRSRRNEKQVFLFFITVRRYK